MASGFEKQWPGEGGDIDRFAGGEPGTVWRGLGRQCDARARDPRHCGQRGRRLVNRHLLMRLWTDGWYSFTWRRSREIREDSEGYVLVVFYIVHGAILVLGVNRCNFGLERKD